MQATQSWARAFAAGWAGVLLCVGVIATPAVFATLASADAGRVVGRLLAVEAYLSFGLALMLSLLERRHAKNAAEAGAGSVLSTEMLLLLGTIFCTIAGYFIVQPLMAAARVGLGTWSFGALHAASAGFFVLKALLVLVLTWRLHCQ